MVFFLMIGAVSAQEDVNVTVSEISAAVDENLEQSLDSSSGEANKTSQFQSKFEDDKLADGDSESFTELKTKINALKDGEVLELGCNYIYDGTDSYFYGIEITQNNIVIDGAGYTIDGNPGAKNARIF